MLGEHPASMRGAASFGASAGARRRSRAGCTTPRAAGAAARAAGHRLSLSSEKTRASGHRRRPRAPHVPLFLGNHRRGHRARARSLSDLVGLQHRSGRLRADRVCDRRRARLHHACRGAPAHRRHAALPARLPQGPQATAWRATKASTITSSRCRTACAPASASCRRSTPRCCCAARCTCSEFFDSNDAAMSRSARSSTS